MPVKLKARILRIRGKHNTHAVTTHPPTTASSAPGFLKSPGMLWKIGFSPQCVFTLLNYSPSWTGGDLSKKYICGSHSLLCAVIWSTHTEISKSLLQAEKVESSGMAHFCASDSSCSCKILYKIQILTQLKMKIFLALSGNCVFLYRVFF